MPNKSQKGKQVKKKTQKTKTVLSLPVKENIIDIPILEKIGFKKVPTTDGFVMYELTPSRLNQQKETA
jgi:hypothetical protein